MCLLGQNKSCKEIHFRDQIVLWTLKKQVFPTLALQECLH